MNFDLRVAGLVVALLCLGAQGSAQDDMPPPARPDGNPEGYAASGDDGERDKAQPLGSQAVLERLDVPAWRQNSRSLGEQARDAEHRQQPAEPDLAREQLRALLGAELLALLEMRQADRSVLLGGRSGPSGFDADRMWLSPARGRGMGRGFGRGRFHPKHGFGWNWPTLQRHRGWRRGNRF